MLNVSNKLRNEYNEQTVSKLVHTVYVKDLGTNVVTTIESNIKPFTEDIGIDGMPIGKFPIGILNIELTCDYTKQFKANGNYEIWFTDTYTFADKTSETVTYKKYTVSTIEYDRKNQVTKFEAYDYANKLNVKFEDIGATLPITFGQYVQKFYTFYGLQVDITNLFMKDYVLKTIPTYDSDVSALQVARDIGKLALSVQFINHENKVKFVRASSFVSSTALTTLNSVTSFNAFPDHYKTKGVNTLVLGLQADIESENVSKSDSSMIATDGKIELRLDDIPFIWNQALKQEVIDLMFNEIKGFKYRAYDMETRHFFYEIGDVIAQNVDLVDGQYNLVVLSNVTKRNGSILSTYEAQSQSTEQTEKAWEKFESKRQTEIQVDKANQSIKQIIQKQTDTEDKLVTIESDLDSITSQVSSLAVGSNIIYNLNFEDDMSGWRFLNDGYLTFGEKARFYLGSLMNSNAIPFTTHSLSKSSIRFFRTGTALSPKGYVVPNSVYSYKARRMDNLQRYTVTVIEYNSSNTEIKRTPFNLVSKQYEEFTIQPAQNTMYIALQFDVYDSTVLTLSEQMFARGNPANYQESAESVKIWAQSQFVITDNQIKSMVSDIQTIDGKTVTNESNISQLSKKIVLGVNSNGQLVQVELGVDSNTGSYYIVKADQIKLEGIVTVDGNFKVFEDGSIEVNNGVFKGTINTNKDAKVGDRVEFPVLVPASLGELALMTNGGRGGVLWGYNPDGNATRAKLVYFDLRNLSSPSRMIMSTDGDFHMYANNSIKLFGGSSNVVFDSIGFYSENSTTIGNSNHRWSTIYLQNQPNVSSDIRYKSNIQDIDNDLLDAFEEVIPKLFNTQFDNNIHFGYIAQDVERALYKYCLKKYGYEYANEKVKQFAVLSKSESYLSLLYGELTVIKDAYYHREVERLKLENEEERNKNELINQKNEILEREIMEIKQFIGMGENNA